jgi:hypothetical protein
LNLKVLFLLGELFLNFNLAVMDKHLLLKVEIVLSLIIMSIKSCVNMLKNTP